MQNSRLIQDCFPIKIDEVWIDRFCVRYYWWRRLQPTSSVSPVWCMQLNKLYHYRDVIISTMAPQITRLTIVQSTVYSGPDQRKYQSSASLAFVRGIHRWPVDSPHKGPVTRKILPFDDFIMWSIYGIVVNCPESSFYELIYLAIPVKMVSISKRKCYDFDEVFVTRDASELVKVTISGAVSNQWCKIYQNDLYVSV